VAACLPLAGVVALRCVAAVQPAAGDRILILGAPGGVGSLAVQLAAGAGAHVIASGLATDGDYLTGLGAADVVPPGEGLIDKIGDRYPDGIAGLIDLVSYRPAFLAHAGLLAPGGRAASVHRAVDEAAFAARGLRGTNVTSAPDRALLDRLAGLAITGKRSRPRYCPSHSSRRRKSRSARFPSPTWMPSPIPTGPPSRPRTWR
jgi:NADPH:quinone reductase-like Zn-dependent oxidoreductase